MAPEAKAAAPAASAEPSRDDTIARLGSQAPQIQGCDQAAHHGARRVKKRGREQAKKIAELEKAGGPEEIAKLRQSIRDTGHRAKFNELATAAGAKPKALDDLWEKSGYKADTDTPDEKAMSKLIEAQREQRDYLFDGDGTEPAEKIGFIDGPPEPGIEHIVKPAAGRGQGGTQRATGSQTQITDAQLRDPVWCRANQAKIAKVAAEVSGMTKTEVGTKLAIM